ncbi:unnamed protein product [Amaranthus hypochondriacus]
MVLEGYGFSMEEVGYELLQERRWVMGYSGRWDGGGFLLVGTQHDGSMVVLLIGEDKRNRVVAIGVGNKGGNWGGERTRWWWQLGWGVGGMVLAVEVWSGGRVVVVGNFLNENMIANHLETRVTNVFFKK